MDRDTTFERLYRRFYGRVVGYLIKSFGLARDDARDAAQDVFLRIFESLDQYRGEAEWAYIQSTARHVALNMIREQHAAKRSSTISFIDVEVVRLSSDIRDLRAEPEQRLAAREMTTRLSAAIDSLPTATRNILLLRLNNLTYDKIALTLGITVNTVKTRMQAAQVRLREQLAIDAFAPHLAVEWLDNVIPFPSPNKSDFVASAGAPNEESMRQLLEKVETLARRLRELVQQIEGYSHMLNRHEMTIATNTVAAVAALRSPGE